MNKLRRFFKRRGKKGFSLVEVIVATALVMVIGSTMLSLFSQGTYYLGKASALRVQGSEANESIKLGKSITSPVNDISYGSEDRYKIRTSLNLGGDIKTGGSSQEYIFVTASSRNDTTQTVVYYSDFVIVDDNTV